MLNTPRLMRCESCGEFDEDCLPDDPPWDICGTCPACIAENTPATEDCDLCRRRVDRREWDSFIAVTDHPGGQLLGFRHSVCDILSLLAVAGVRAGLTQLPGRHRVRQGDARRHTVLHMTYRGKIQLTDDSGERSATIEGDLDSDSWTGFLEDVKPYHTFGPGPSVIVLIDGDRAGQRAPVDVDQIGLAQVTLKGAGPFVAP